jgi:site-specific DNA-methyltransferase (adenine-specific)
MKSISKNKIDLVITDPPFAINFKAKKANYNRISSRVISGYNEIKPEDYYAFTYSWMKEVHRVLKESGGMYVFSGWNNLKDILRAIDDVGFTTINHIVWKYQFGVVTKKKFVTSHYHCLYVCKDEKKILGSKKKTKLLKDEAYTTKIKKMFGRLKENIGPEMKKPQQNFLLN